MHKKLLIALLLFCSFYAKGQTWDRTYLIDTNSSIANDFFLNSNGGLIIGTEQIPLTTNTFPYIIRTNTYGDTLWTKYPTISNFSNSAPVTCVQLTNGNFAVGYVNNYSSEYAIMKLSPGGNILSQMTSSVYRPGSAKLLATKNSGYYFIYDDDSASLGNNNLGYSFYRSYVDKYDSNDVKQWEAKFEWSHIDTLPSVNWSSGYTNINCNNVILSYDGGIIYPISWDTVDFHSGAMKYSLQKRDQNGAIVWTTDLKSFLPPQDTTHFLQKIFSTSDSGFDVNVYSTDAYAYTTSHLLKFNRSGILTDSASFLSNCYVEDGIETSNRRLLFISGCGNDVGFSFYDENLHFSSYTPSPFSYGIDKLTTNTQGGAFCVTNGVMLPSYLNYIRAINFDSLFNTYPSSISGNLILDKNDNCTTETTDLRIKDNPVMMTDAQNNQWFAFTNDTGHYKVNVPTGNYTLGHQVYGYKGTECPATSALSYTIPTPAQYTGVNLYDTLTRNKPNISTSIYNFCFVPGFDNTLYLNVNNYGTVTANTTLTFVKDPAIQYLSSVPAPTSISGDTLTYTVNNLPADSALSFVIELHTPSTASAGQPLTFYANAPFANDLNIADNSASLIDTIVSSYDPNEKTVNKPLHYDPNTGEMIYAVQFQNTGTYYAKNVVVVDTIDSHLDMSSFHLIKGSPFAPVISWWEGNRLLFTYNNIMLPDSMQNPKTSIGSFVYGIKPKANVHIGDTIRNTAYIYFDFNKAVVTNTTMNIISKMPNAVSTIAYSNDVAVYPNPSAGTVTILVPQQSGDWNITLLDMTGREMKYATTTSGNKIVLKTSAPNGIYLLQLMNTTTKESVVKKITVLR